MLQTTIFVWMTVVWILLEASSPRESKGEKESKEEICLFDTPQLRCANNEVILMKSATYGRMRIGRCITAEEVADQRLMVGDGVPILGCSADVLPILNQKCSGKTECEIRINDIPEAKFKPCFPGLKMYLEIAFVCLRVADEGRSCTVVASKDSIHILRSPNTKALCGTKSQPWVVEAPSGQKLQVVLIDISPNVEQSGPQARQSCLNNGVIVEKIGKKNASICGDGVQREKELYSSAGNLVHIYLNPVDAMDEDGANIMLKVTAIGCSDIIPPEDSWLKRNDDAIVIGCYSSRQTWQLNCRAGNWVGVLGNCSQGVSIIGTGEDVKAEELLSNSGQVLAVVAIGGFTLTICLIIIFIGAIYLRRFYSRRKREYKTLNYKIGSNQSQSTGPHIPTEFAGNEMSGFVAQQQLPPTYSVFLGEDERGGQETNLINGYSTNLSARI